MTPAPTDRIIEVRSREDGVWVRARWNPKGLTEIDGRDVMTGRWEGDETYLAPDEIDDWREVAHPALDRGPLAT